MVNYMQLNLFNTEDSHRCLTGDTQVCKICSKEKDIHFFNKHVQFKTKIDNRCRACVKKQSKLRKDLYAKYGFLKGDTCDCCGEKHHKSLVLDHDHKTLSFRGFICEPCNHGLGKLGDDLEGVEKALAYLRKQDE